MKMEQTECSETLAYKIQMLRNYPKDSIQHSEHRESLKSRIVMEICFSAQNYNYMAYGCVGYLKVWCSGLHCTV